MLLARALLFVLGLATIWLAPHPPMVDLPQHAGQVALLNDLIHHKSPWSDLVWVNFRTPYLIAYLLSIFLAQHVPIVVAFKILLSIGYACFIAMCALLRREYRADPRLDIYSYVVFFGFAYHWGFLTFLVASPIALLLILLAKRLIDQPQISTGLGLFVVGLLLLFSHGLAFVYAFATGSALFGWGWVKQRMSLAYALPFLGLAVSLVIFLFISRDAEAAHAAVVDNSTGYFLRFNQLGVILKLFTNDSRFSLIDLSYALCFAIFAVAPWVMGLRIQTSKVDRIIPFVIICLILLFAPSYILGTAFVYERFAMFLAPTYAWMFAEGSQSSALNDPRASQRQQPLCLSAVPSLVSGGAQRLRRLQFRLVPAQSGPLHSGARTGGAFRR